MASKITVTAKTLEALGPARLAALLMDLAEADAAVKRRLRLELADSEGPAAVAAEVRKRLVAIGRASAFVDWRRNAALAADLDRQRETIAARIAPREPALALELMWRFMALAPSVHARCDDSNGRIGGVFANGCADLCRIAAAAQPEPLALADSVFEALAANDYAQFDRLIGGMAPALGAEGLGHLKMRLRVWAETAPKAIKEGDRVVGWSAGTGSIRHGDLERRRIESTVGLALREIADALGDVDAFIAQHSAQAQRMPVVAAAIAERLLAAGRAAEALVTLDAADAERVRRGEEAWEAARVAALEALGRTDEAQAFRWTCFEQRLAADHLRAYLKKLPDFEDIAAEERALAIARSWPEAHAALHFLVEWPALEHAADLVIARAIDLNGDLYELLSPTAETLADRYPLAATLVLRAMIAFTLREARSSRYGHAARHLAACARMAGRIEDWRGAEPHDAYSGRLKVEHGRKSGFWSRVE